VVTAEQVYDVLQHVYDPELGVNIVDLGLVYDVAIHDAVVDVTMTMTTPGCPMHDAISEGAQIAVSSLPGVQEARLHIVWFPQWDPSMMSEAARSELWG
jgi:metal-sulfur cluster biosynthetic enzyme